MNRDLILREKLALARTVLANQSTLLSFIRTSMYFLVAGISINNLTTIKQGHFIEIVFVIISVILLGVGVFNFIFQKKRINKSKKHIGEYRMEYLEKE